MRLSQIQKKYITEGWNDPDMLLLEQKAIDPFVSNVERIVLEAELTPDQIKQVFANVEKGATEAGGNRTAVGKGADAVKNTAGAIKAEIDKLGSAIKNAGPVQNMDAKFNELKTKIGDKDSKVVSAVKAVSDWAKENPGKASVAVAILTAAAALAGGPLGGLVGGFLGRATKDILQGKDLSTAIGKSAMTGAVGAAAGGAIELIGDLVDPDVSQAIIASDGQTIDVAGLEGMKATSIENLAPEAAEDLLKTQNALETAMRNVSGEELEVFQAEFEEISDKINDLGGRDALADHAGLEGQDLERATTTSTDVGVDKSGSAGEIGFTSTDSGASYTDEEIKNVLKTAAEKGEVPDWDSLVNSKDVDPGTYADDISRLEMAGRELGFDPLKVPDADAVDAIQGGDATAGADGPGGDSPDAGATDMSEVETVKAEPVSAAELKEVGINFDAEPDIKPEVAEWAKSKGLDPEQVQKMFQMEKGMADARFMGTNVSASSEMASNWTGDAPTLGETTLPDGAEIKVGEQFKSTTSTSVGGIEPPISFTSTVTVEGVDANGDPVFAVKEVSTMPSHPLWDNIDKANLSDEDFEQLMAFMDEYSGTGMDSKAGIKTVIDTFKQDLAKSIGAAATAVAMGTAMQDKKVVPANAQPAQESIDYKVKRLSEGQIYMLFNRVERVNTHMLENKMMFESVFDAVSHYHRKQALTEFDKGGLSALGGALKKGAKAVGGAISGAAKQVTTKVTAEKLNTAWKKAGSPTDSAEVYNVIKGLGVADDVIKGTFDSMKIEVPAATDAPDGDQDPGAADAETNADAPTDSTAGDSGSDTTDTGAADANAGGDTPAATNTPGDTATTSADNTTGSTTSAKDERYYLQKNTKDETKVDIIDKQTSKPIKNGVALAPEKAEPMSDKMNKEAGKYAGAKGDKFIMQPNAQNPKTYDVLDTQTDQPVQNGAALQPGEAEELRDKMNSQSTTSTTTDKTSTDGATDANTASTSGGEQPDATTDPQSGETPTADQNAPATADQNAPTDASPAPDNRGAGQGQDTAAPGGPQTAPVDINKLAAELKKLNPDQIEDAKKLLAA
jgi:uncharacterized protein (UPF0335 family)